MARKMGIQTAELLSKPRIMTTYTIVGPKEGEGPLGIYFDEILADDMCGCKSFELAESKMQLNAVQKVIERANLKEKDISCMFAGDLLNQIMSSCFMAREVDIPFIGMYGACSTFVESLCMASMALEGDFGEHVLVATSSHFSSAERQFRLPLEMGSQRSPASQWTVTGAAAVILAKKGKAPYVTHITIGKVKDYGIKDPNEMGAAMSPAAVDTIKQHFEDTGRKPSDYDLIVTGDLGSVGKQITTELLKEYGYNIAPNYIDCGDEIFDCQCQGTNCGGSGAGCSATIMSSMVYKGLLQHKYKRVLLIATGALLSTTSNLQGETIPGIAHAIALEFGGK
ncbi:MAG: stage V sporulation protein AD [Clostridium sp.]|uniref:stage V sporulation protein AD n=1 Tax=Clostridium sp. TaxID=1506 RepID=UPI003045AC31